MLKFKYATAKNYLSIGEVAIDLEDRGLVLIEGINDANETFQSNGSGKSTLLSIVTFALFGVTPNGLKADAVINRTAGKGMAVVLDFEKDGVPYRIERYRKHGKYKNATKFFQGSNNLTQKSVAETDKKIQAVFGIDYLTYMNSIMYGQGDVEIFAKATDKGKKQILENLADIGVYRFAQDVAKEKAKECNARVEEFQRQRELKEQELTFKKTAYDQAVLDYAATKEAIESQEAWVAQLENNVAALKEEEAANRVSLEEELRDYDMSLLEAQAKTNNNQINAELQAQLDQAKDGVTKLTLTRNQLLQQLTDAQLALQKVASETNCYVCGAPLDAAHRENEMARLNAEIQKQNENIAKIDGALPAYTKKRDALQEQMNQEITSANSANSEYQTLLDGKSRVERQMENLGNEVQQAQTELDGARDVLKAHNSVPSPVYDQEGADKISVELNEIDAKLREAKEDAEQYKILSEEVFSNKGIRSDVLDLVTPFLNERANKYLAILSGSDIEIRFSTQTTKADGELTDKFDLEVLNGSGGETYQSNSAGEKKRIDLAISFAIQDLVQSKANIAVNLGLYDECFDGLDSIGCENVIKILKERQKEVSSIFVITHSENLKPLFENVITMKKENGQSFLVS